MCEKEFSGPGVGVVVADVQADFTELRSGSLAVPGTDQAYIDAVIEATRAFRDRGLPIYTIKDWHPVDHMSFYTNNPGTEPFQTIEVSGRTQVMWPPHCVQNTPGAELVIPSDLATETILKGMDPKYDSYSAFADDGGKKTELENILLRDGTKKVIVYGLATDYCVRATAIDGAIAGFQVCVLLRLSRGIAPETVQKAIREMKEKGIMIS